MLFIFILIPLVGFGINLLLPDKKEKLISWSAFATTGLHLAGAWAFLLYWLYNGAGPIDQKEIVLFKSAGYEFFIDFYFDRITALYLFVGTLLTFMVTVYSRY